MAIVVLGVIASFLRAGIAAKGLLREKLDDIFRDEASHFFDKGAFDELIKLCEDKLKSKPHDVRALVYRKGLLPEGRSPESKRLF